MPAVMDMYATTAYYSPPATEQVAPFEPVRRQFALRTGDAGKNFDMHKAAARAGFASAFADSTSQFAQLGETEARGRLLEVTRTGSPEPQQLRAVVDGSHVRDLSDQRMKILAASFAGSSSKELSARLEILNARMEKRLPRVTSEQVARLESAADLLAGIDAMRANLHMRRKV